MDIWSLGLTTHDLLLRGMKSPKLGGWVTWKSPVPAAEMSHG